MNSKNLSQFSILGISLMPKFSGFLPVIVKFSVKTQEIHEHVKHEIWFLKEETLKSFPLPYCCERQGITEKRMGHLSESNGSLLDQRRERDLRF